MSGQNRNFNLKEVIASAYSSSAKNQGLCKAQLEMPDVISTVDGEIGEEIPISVRNWIEIYDQFASWVVNCAVLGSMELLALEGGVSTQRRVVVCLIANISSQVIAIRRLVLAGLDVQAKQLVRMLTEQIDVAILIALDEKSAENFALTDNGAEANKFWHQNISKQKFRNMLFSAIRGGA